MTFLISKLRNYSEKIVDFCKNLRYNTNEKGEKMPSYMIHLCLAKEYARKYKVENEEQFIEGTFYPDNVEIKGETHYSPYYSSDTNLYEFLLDKKLNSSFNEGYFLHLVADCVFYNKYFADHREFDRAILRKDFDILNPHLMSRYGITKTPREVKQYMVYQEGETVEYHYDKVIQFIEEVSNYELHKLEEKILQEKDFQFLLK